MIPPPQYPEYRCTLVWRSDADGNGTRVYLAHIRPEEEEQPLQTSFHPILDLQEALDRALTQFFEKMR